MHLRFVVPVHYILGLHLFMLNCTSSSPQESCHRLYHDEGRHCTLLELAEHAHKVVFMSGDPSMIYCTSYRGVSLLNLKAIPECAAFCQACKQQLRPTTAAYKGNAVQKQSAPGHNHRPLSR
jgi:hypothetical protein